MASMNGDPIVEAKYNEWKKNMMRVTQANPSTESRKLPNGAEIANDTIFGHLSNVGFSKNQLEAVIPYFDTDRYYLDTLYGLSIYIDHTGRFQFSEEETEESPRVLGMEDVIIEPTCGHGFVVRDISGNNRFHCKECDERFPRHPSMMPKKIAKFKNAPFSISHSLHNTAILTQFREGVMTFSEAVKATGFSLERFTEEVQRLFPPEQITNEIYTLDSLTPTVVNLGEEPKRVSCYKEIEDVFGNPNLNVDQINQFMDCNDIFPDVTEVTHGMDQTAGTMTVEIIFVDGSIQRVEISAHQLMANNAMPPFGRRHGSR